MEEKSKLDKLTAKAKQKRRKEKRKIRNSMMFNNILKVILGAYLQIRFNVVVEERSVFKGLKPPYFVMSTHNCFWGPFFVANYVPYPVSYVVSDANFRNPLMKFGLSMIGSIPKTKVLSDMDTVKHILDVKNREGVIGLYPEGQNSYDGHSLPLVFSTAKLVKRLAIPVIIADKSGSYLSMPRWAKASRKGKVLLSYKMGFTSEDLKSLSVDEIFARLQEYLTHDEFEFQRKAMIPFKGRDRAEYLEILLFICPHCHSLARLESKGNDFTCKECGYQVHYNEYGFFESANEHIYFDNLRDWNMWQLDYLRTTLTERVEKSTEQVFLEDPNMNIHVGYKSNPMEKSGTGTMQLFYDHLLFLDNEGEILSFPFDDILGINMHNGEKMEFYFRDTLFRLDCDNKRVSLYKWYNFIKFFQDYKGKV